MPAQPDAPRREHKILIVDDEAALRRFCRYALQEADATHCDEAVHGLAALEMIRKGQYDLVLSDIDMPELSGPDLCRRLRDNPPYPHLKFIMMSGRATPDEMSRILLAGADDYLSKPLSIVQLKSKVAAALSLKDAQDRAEALNATLLLANHELERTLRASKSDLIHSRHTMVKALAKRVECRQIGSSSHLLRMEHYSRTLAEEAAAEPAFAGQIDAKFTDLLVCCAPLHDIGKVGLPDYILLKPGKLDIDERLLMETHTTSGADALKGTLKDHGPAGEFLKMAGDIIRSHHERFDGEGYPDQLAGNDIPLAARLVSLADVYDALRSRRTYRPAFLHAASLQLMAKTGDGQFDPKLMPAFARCARRFEQIFQEFAD